MTLYFAYGSNMSRAAMRRRCPGARAIGPAVLDGHRFVIIGDGYASVLPSPGGSVHGLLWRLDPRALAALNAYESLDSGLYRTATLPVRTGGQRVAALVYVARSRTPGRPRPGYIEDVIAAARELDFPPDYVEALARWAPAGLRALRPCETGAIA
jgi:gamma-glutamylcyclotransferase (GGCT)/AIG2-like uncharacterized protein YtfP